ncbi:palindromic element RPE4 domain-containing protein [Rickettsia asembonensis]|uniref:palindromic element RPE4 domain-containing protein n=1 Tax=Rickettsia asembonensis TaxID=1068590 RepID=UPI000AB9A5AA
MAAISFQQGIVAWIPPRHYERLQTLLHGSISPLSSRGLTTVSSKITKNTNIISIFN